jgi:hypothetical protein
MRRPKSPHGTGTVQVCRVRIRLVWTYPLSRRRIYLALGLPNSAINRNAAQQKALFIQNNMGSGNYDHTLKKYKSESQIERDRLTIIDRFQRFMQHLSIGNFGDNFLISSISLSLLTSPQRAKSFGAIAEQPISKGMHLPCTPRISFMRCGEK